MLTRIQLFVIVLFLVLSSQFGQTQSTPPSKLSVHWEELTASDFREMDGGQAIVGSRFHRPFSRPTLGFTRTRYLNAPLFAGNHLGRGNRIGLDEHHSEDQ